MLLEGEGLKSVKIDYVICITLAKAISIAIDRHVFLISLDTLLFFRATQITLRDKFQNVKDLLNFSSYWLSSECSHVSQ